MHFGGGSVVLIDDDTITIVKHRAMGFSTWSISAPDNRRGQTTAELRVFDPWMYKFLTQTRLLMHEYHRHHGDDVLEILGVPQ